MKKRDLIRKNMVESVNNERNILAMAQNPFVVRFYYSFTSRENLYIVMEYINGGDCYRYRTIVSRCTADGVTGGGRCGACVCGWVQACECSWQVTDLEQQPAAVQTAHPIWPARPPARPPAVHSTARCAHLAPPEPLPCAPPRP